MTDPIDTLAALDRGGRVALVHDWLTGMRGGEKCLEIHCEMFPCADLFTLVHVPGSVAPVIESRRIFTSFIQRMPRAATGYRKYLPLFPAAIESFDLSAYDLVLSSSHCVAKGARVAPHALHVSYCFTPMRYVWDQFDAYFGPGRAGLATRAAATAVRGSLQRWDVRTAAGVDLFVADSKHVRKRIRRYWDRDAAVVYPPVDCSAFAIDERGPEDYYLVVAALAGYKRVDLAVRAARAAGVRLRVVGRGPDEARLREMAGGDARIEFLGWRSDVELASLYARCRALVFPGEEDFGIAPLECMASGRPVIAWARGGALETVLDGRTGQLIDSSEVDDWAAALRDFDSTRFESRALRQHALEFDRPRYAERMRTLLLTSWDITRGSRVSSPHR